MLPKALIAVGLLASVLAAGMVLLWTYGGSPKHSSPLAVSSTSPPEAGTSSIPTPLAGDFAGTREQHAEERSTPLPPTPASKAASRTSLYKNDTYGFQLQVPEGWTFKKTDFGAHFVSPIAVPSSTFPEERRPRLSAQMVGYTPPASTSIKDWLEVLGALAINRDPGAVKTEDRKIQNSKGKMIHMTGYLYREKDGVWVRERHALLQKSDTRIFVASMFANAADWDDPKFEALADAVLTSLTSRK